MAQRTFDLTDMAATKSFAKAIAGGLRSGDYLALKGPLGAGKTAFARALLMELGVVGEVPSPTFTLLQTYDAPAFCIYHFDLYRLKNADELDELGWDDALGDGLVLAEWPERAENRQPIERLELDFQVQERGARKCVVTYPVSWHERLQDMLP